MPTDQIDRWLESLEHSPADELLGGIGRLRRKRSPVDGGTWPVARARAALRQTARRAPLEDEEVVQELICDHWLIRDIFENPTLSSPRAQSVLEHLLDGIQQVLEGKASQQIKRWQRWQKKRYMLLGLMDGLLAYQRHFGSFPAHLRQRLIGFLGDPESRQSTGNQPLTALTRPSALRLLEAMVFPRMEGWEEQELLDLYQHYRVGPEDPAQILDYTDITPSLCHRLIQHPGQLPPSMVERMAREESFWASDELVAFARDYIREHPAPHALKELLVRGHAREYRERFCQLTELSPRLAAQVFLFSRCQVDKLALADLAPLLARLPPQTRKMVLLEIGQLEKSGAEG